MSSPTSQSADLAALLGATTPACALALAEEALARASAEARPEPLETLLAALEEGVASGRWSKKDWVAPLLERGMFAEAATLDELGGGKTPGGERLSSLLLAGLDEMEPDERARLVADVTGRAHDVSLLCALVLAAEHDRGPSYFGATSATLTMNVLDRISDLAAMGTLWSQRAPAALLWFWFTHGDEQRLYQFTRKAMQDPTSLAILLTVPLERIAAADDDGDVVAVRRWSRIIDFRTLEQKALELAVAGPSRTARRRARRFLEAFGDGKSDLFR